MSYIEQMFDMVTSMDHALDLGAAAADALLGVHVASLTRQQLALGWFGHSTSSIGSRLPIPSWSPLLTGLAYGRAPVPVTWPTG